MKVIDEILESFEECISEYLTSNSNVPPCQFYGYENDNCCGENCSKYVLDLIQKGY